MGSLTSIAARLRADCRVALVVTRDLGCEQAAEVCPGLAVTRLRAPTPGTHAAGLATLLWGVEPPEHGVMGDEIFVGGGSLCARDGRLSRRERRYYRHYARHGWPRLLAAHWQRLWLPRSLAARRTPASGHALWRDEDYPYLRRLLGLDRRAERVDSLERALARVDESASKQSSGGPWLVLGHTFGLGNRELLGAFGDWCRRSHDELTRLLVSVSNCTPVDYALMFTQGEIVWLMSRGVFLCISGRWCGVYGDATRRDEVAALFGEKFSSRARFTPSPYGSSSRAGPLALPFAVATAQGSAVFAYEQLPRPSAGGGDSEAERWLPLVTSAARPPSAQS